MDIISSVFAHAVAVSALAVVALHQILKLKIVPSTFANRYPVPTLIVLSVIASVMAVWKTAVTPHTWTDWLVLVATIAVAAALTYRTTIANWAELRSLEG